MLVASSESIKAGLGFAPKRQDLRECRLGVALPPTRRQERSRLRQESLGAHVPHGFNLLVSSEVPMGSGLSSSAALEVSLLRALRERFALPFDDVQLAQLGQRAENELVGANVGIMDQMAASVGRPGSALYLDTRSLRFEEVRLPETLELCVIDSGVRHSHAGGEYNTRRRECAEAARLLGVEHLCSLRESDLPRVERLPEPLRRRARHAVTEEARVAALVEALRAGDHHRARELMAASQASMRDDYEVSVPLVDAIVATATRTAGIVGARLTGGGFGGAVVLLAEASLRRLRVERIDLYQVHWPPADGTAIEEYWATMVALRDEGKVRAVGLSNHDLERLKRAERVGHIDSLQPPFSLIRRSAAAELVPRCAQADTGVIVYSPMQSGLLAGRMTAERVACMPADDWRGCHEDFRGANATLEVGPRVIRFALPSGPNVFKEFDEQLGQTSGREWSSFGGHRLWHAPEGPHPEALAPARALVLWHFTRMDDPRYRWGERLIELRQDDALASTRTKFGAGNKQGWAAYQLGELRLRRSLRPAIDRSAGTSHGET